MEPVHKTSSASANGAAAPRPAGAPAQPRHFSLDAIVLGRYRLLEIVGRGAFAVVYRAVQEGVGRNVALKVFRVHRSARSDPKLTETALVRFQREAHLASQLQHPNTITLFDYDKNNQGVVYMAFEFVDGPTLSAEIKANPQGISPERVLHIAKQVVASLQEAHAQGIIHRDMKPGNVMLMRQHHDPDFVKVLDFGIAKLVSTELEDPEYTPNQSDGLEQLDLSELTQADAELTLDGKIVGTPRYIPPEQIQGHDLSPSADLYSLGLIMHELLTGTAANPGKTPEAMIRWHMTGQAADMPEGAKLPGALAEVIARATQRKVSDRYATAKAMQEDLDRIGPDGEWLPEPNQGKPVAVVLAAVFGVLLLVAIGVIAWILTREPAPAETPATSAPAAVAPKDDPSAAKPEPGNDATTPSGEAAGAPKAAEDGATPDTTPPTADKGAESAPEAPAQPTDASVLNITSTPAGAIVYLKRKPIGRTPLEHKLDPKQRQLDLILSKPGYVNARVRWDADNPAKTRFPVVLRRKRGGGGGGNNGAGGAGGQKGGAGGGSGYRILQ